jgi:hypothetical protein
MTRQLDWERANKGSLPPYDPRPGEEISEALAKEDREFLAKRTTLRKKRTKYVRTSSTERAVRKLMEVPESIQERRLRTVLATLSHGKSLFELQPAGDASCRLFERKDVRLRIKVDGQMRRQLIAISPGEPASFDWVTVSVAPGALDDRNGGFLAARLKELISKQNQLRQARNG